MAALSEIRFSEEGSLREHGAGYTLYWSGKLATERRLSGVGFMIRDSIATKLASLPAGHSDRIISMRLPSRLASGPRSAQNRDWFDENNLEVQELLSKKRSAHKAHLAQPSCQHKKSIRLQRKLREIQNEWWTNLAFSMMLQQTKEDLDDADGAYIRFCFDGSVFNLRCLQAHTKTMELLIRELLFADDAALLAHTEAAMQRITSCFAKTAQIFGLEVSLKKTEVLHQPAPQKEYHPPSISIEQTERDQQRS
ncbi:unnamed protein product [Leuciscus chuanchicus]